TPEAHDRQAAVVSHLPHLAAVALVQVAETLGGLDLASTGYRDTTRLASSNPGMRADILLANRSAVRDALSAMTERLAALDALLSTGDREAIRSVLDEVAKARAAWIEQGPSRG
ncbi:MAG: prephenate dehydrogenase dimerization domain-containing protein, partial [Phycisphaeraceae bacterium]